MGKKKINEPSKPFLDPPVQWLTVVTQQPTSLRDLSSGDCVDALDGAEAVYGVTNVREQLLVGVSRATVEQQLDTVARSRTGSKHTDRTRNDEVPRRQEVVRAELAESLDLRLELLDPRRTLNRLVREPAERHRRRADVVAAVFELIQRVDELTVRGEQVSGSLHQRWKISRYFRKYRKYHENILFSIFSIFFDIFDIYIYIKHLHIHC